MTIPLKAFTRWVTGLFHFLMTESLRPLRSLRLRVSALYSHRRSYAESSASDAILTHIASAEGHGVRCRHRRRWSGGSDMRGILRGRRIAHAAAGTGDISARKGLRRLLESLRVAGARSPW